MTYIQILEKAAGSYETIKNQLRDAISAVFPPKIPPGRDYPVEAWIVDTYADYIVVEFGGKYYKVTYSIDKDGVTWGEPEEVEITYTAAEEESHVLGVLVEGWLPSNISQNDLDDGDFAWLSNAYKNASKAKRKKMNKRVHRKLPYKIHGKVNLAGWKAAWIAAAHQTARHPSFKGGPGQKAVLAKLRRDKPAGITIAADNTITAKPAKKKKKKAKEGALPRTVILAHDQPMEVLVCEEDDAGEITQFRYRGVALVDYAISEHGRYYSPEFNDIAAEETNAYMENGGVVTVYSRHGKAVSSRPGELATGLPVGKVDSPLTREGNVITYTASISPTTEGKDVAILIRDGVVKPTSIRSRDFEAHPGEINGRPVAVMERAVITGIDLAEGAGIAGAGIVQVLEEQPTITTPHTEEAKMDWKAITLESLTENRPDLILEYDGQKYQAVNKKIADLEANNARLTEELATAQTTIDTKVAEAVADKDKRIAALEKELADNALEQAIAQAVSEQPYATILEQALRVGFTLIEKDKDPVVVAACATPDDVKAHLEQAQAYVQTLVSGILAESKRTTIKGQVLTGGNAARDLTEEQREAIRLAGGKDLTEEVSE